MDFSSIIITILGIITGGFLFQIIDRVRYKKHDMKHRDEQAKQEALETESKDIENELSQIELGKNAVDMASSILVQLKDMQNLMMDNIKSMSSQTEKFDKIHEDIKSVKDDVKDIVEFLNGDFQKWKNENKYENKKKEKK